MPKSELVARISARTELSNAGAADLLDAMLSAISKALARGESVGIAGSGIFSVKDRAAREGRNPRTGESIAIAAWKGVSFKAGEGLRDAINGGCLGRQARGRLGLTTRILSRDEGTFRGRRAWSPPTAIGSHLPLGPEIVADRQGDRQHPDVRPVPVLVAACVDAVPRG